MFGWGGDKQVFEHGSRTDDNIDDEAAGKARILYRQQSEAARQREMADQRERAASMKNLVKNAGQRTDDDVDDDLMADGRTIGQARTEAAAASKAKKAAEAARIAKANAEMQERLNLKNVAQRTDDDVDDDVMADGRTLGEVRAALAESSRKRREAEQKALAKREREFRARMKNAGQRSDDDIEDEAAGRARVALAEASREKKAEEARLLAERNAEMKERIRKTRPRTVDELNRSKLVVGFDAVDEADVADAMALAEATREKLARARLGAQRRVTADQAHFRKAQFKQTAAALSRATPWSKTQMVATSAGAAPGSPPSPPNQPGSSHNGVVSRFDGGPKAMRTFVPAIGRRSAALYRLHHVTGQDARMDLIIDVASGVTADNPDMDDATQIK